MLGLACEAIDKFEASSLTTAHIFKMCYERTWNSGDSHVE